MSGYDFGTPRYGLTRVIEGGDLEAVIARTREALAAQGFGVLTEINLQATLKTKLDADVAPYVILGACNPGLAYQALGGEPGIGLLLPCNVVVAQGEAGIIVSAVDPKALFELIDSPEVQPIADQVNGLLQAALEAI